MHLWIFLVLVTSILLTKIRCQTESNTQSTPLKSTDSTTYATYNNDSLSGRNISAKESSLSTAQLWRKHVQLVRNFKCNNPQPRTIYLSELWDVEPSNYVAPPMTVLHRCDAHTGCCLNPFEHCVVHEMEEVELNFQVTNAVSKEVEYRIVHAFNHTKCICEDKKFSVPKR